MKTLAALAGLALTSFTAPVVAASFADAYNGIVYSQRDAGFVPGHGCDSKSCYLVSAKFTDKYAFIAIEHTLKKNGEKVHVWCFGPNQNDAPPMSCSSDKTKDFNIPARAVQFWMGEIVKSNPNMKTSPAPTTTAALAPAPAPASGKLVVPLYSDGQSALVDVLLGSRTPARMVMDTGASMMSISRPIADALIRSGDGTLTDKTQKFQMANGTVANEQVVLINSVTIGGVTLQNVSASVTEGTDMMLLDFTTLNRLGRFSVDMATKQLVFQ